MKKILLAGTAALLLTGATADPSFAAGRGGGGAHFSGGGGGAHFSGGGNVGGGRVGGSFSAAPRAAVTGGSFNRGATFAGRTGFAGRPGFTGRTATFGGRTGHWGWWHGRRHFFPGAAVAAGLGLGFAASGWGWGDDCVVWDGWRYVDVCGGPTVSWGGPGWGPGWGGPGWW